MIWKKCIIISTVFFLASSLAKSETEDQHLKVYLRAIGHEFLLQLDDSSSRVLPIEKIDGRFRLGFERTFAFEPDQLSFAAIKVMNERNITDRYIVEIERCKTGELVHSFEARLEQKKMDLMACKQRRLPEDCYQFFFTPMVKKVPPKDTKHTSALDLKNVYLLLALFMGIGLVFYFKAQIKKPESNKNFIPLGLYQFDKKNMVLIAREHSIQLSGKEADLLFLLLSNENKTLEREHILEVVWGDKGDYVGRTLDVFISKLRKKLEADPSIKIINIRGVGYRFVVS